MIPDDAIAVAVLRSLVSTPSVSGAERGAVRTMVDWMSRFGLRASIDEAGNAVGETGSRDPNAREIVLLGHIDTVPGWVPVKEEGGELWGRGAVDAKGPLAAFLSSGAGLALPDDVRLVVVGAVGEETPTSPGASFIRDTRRPAACVIGEPNSWDRFAIGYKGRLLIEATFEQPCGHSAGPAGAVAERAIVWWQRLCALVASLNEGRDGLFEQLQVALQEFRTSSDGLADRATLIVGFRLPTWIMPGEIEGRVGALDKAPILRAFGHTPAARVERTNDVASAFTGAIADEGGRPRPVLKTGTSDMNTVLASWDCPVVAYGPGDSALDHARDERLSLEEYLRSIRVLRRALPDLAQRVSRAGQSRTPAARPS